MSEFKGRELKIIMSGRRHGKSVVAAYMRLWNDILEKPIEQLILSEGTVYGSRYYCVEPIGGSWLKIETWCNEVYGESGSLWVDTNNGERWQKAVPNARYYLNDRRVWFRDEADRTLFVLRWTNQ